MLKVKFAPGVEKRFNRANVLVQRKRSLVKVSVLKGALTRGQGQLAELVRKHKGQLTAAQAASISGTKPENVRSLAVGASRKGVKIKFRKTNYRREELSQADEIWKQVEKMPDLSRAERMDEFMKRINQHAPPRMQHLVSAAKARIGNLRTKLKQRLRRNQQAEADRILAQIEKIELAVRQSRTQRPEKAIPALEKLMK